MKKKQRALQWRSLGDIQIKVMDSVIVGLEETKSVTIMSSKARDIAQIIVHELGLGLTVMYGRGGYSGKDQEILHVIVERLQLADLKEIVYQEDPQAFISIVNLHEVANGRNLSTGRVSPSAIKSIASKLIKGKKKRRRPV